MKFLALLLVASSLMPVHPESAVEYRGRIFVSDIGQFGKDDGRILIYKKGKFSILTDGLKDPKGICVFNNKLYVTDVDRIWQIDFKGKKKIFLSSNDFPEKPKFLNDITTYKSGLVISDTFGNKVFYYSRKNGVTILTVLPKPNGLLETKEGLFVISFTDPGSLYVFDGRKNIKIYESTKIAGGDGITYAGAGSYYLTGYRSGNIVKIVVKKGEVVASEVVYSNLKSPADIFYSLKKRHLLVPELEAGRFSIK